MPCLFDPDAPGVSKQMMLDWIHINHPKTIIRSRIDPLSLAQLVRSLQPELDFPNSASNTSTHLSAAEGASEIDTSGNIANGQIVTSGIGISGATANYPKIRSIQELQDLKPAIPPSLNPTTGTARQGKRVASSEIKKSPKTTETEARGTSSKITKKKKINHTSRSVNKFTASLGAISPQSGNPPTLPAIVASGQSPVFDEDEQDLKNLRDSIRMPVLPLATSITKPDIATNKSTTPQVVSTEMNGPTRSKKPKDVGPADLIEFSDNELMDAGNLVLGKAIPPILINNMTKTKSGVDVFLEERGREQRICQLENLLAQVLDGVEQLREENYQFAMKFKDLENVTKSTEAVNNRLDRKVQIIERLEPMVTHLQAQVDTLRHNFDDHHEDVVTHGQILERLMQEDEDEEDTEDADDA
ncbi:hypothetical protein DFH28DRAFT_1087879 [Melampsora americana]|nr:hypothetical protein DFH28DRAFT_1087879 [Melampsora americana]